ncbi:MAG: hypothetical protein MUO97_05880 [Dehalococcoidia bacterium]|nr:hypothetical protein [Dehalococcoidia bacterium]
MADIDKAIKDIEQGNAWDESDEVVQVEIKKPLDKVIPVRLSGDKWEELRREARELGVGPTTLARMWLLERLRQRMQGETEVPLEPLNMQSADDQRLKQEAHETKRNHWDVKRTRLPGQHEIIPPPRVEKPMGGNIKSSPTQKRAAQYRP